MLVFILSFAACTSPGKRTGIGAIIGAATGGAVGNYLDRQKKELDRVADTKRVKDGLLVNLKNDLLFETGQAELRTGALNQLNELGRILAKYEQDRIKIAGYTDDVGSSEFNQQLSERRANAVRDLLNANGVRDEQMLIQGFGESKPIASNASSAGRQKNRRVELIIDVPADNQASVEATESRRNPAGSYSPQR